MNSGILARPAIWLGAYYILHIADLGLGASVTSAAKGPVTALSGIVCSLLTLWAVWGLVERFHGSGRSRMTLAIILAVSGAVVAGANLLWLTPPAVQVPSATAAGSGTSHDPGLTAEAGPVPEPAGTTQEAANPAVPPGPYEVHAFALVNLGLIFFAAAAGTLLGGIIEKPSYLIPVCAVAGIADLWSVFSASGVTKAISTSRTALNFVLVSFPVLGYGVRPLIGVTDFIFAGLFVFMAVRFSMPLGKTALLLGAAFVVSVGLAVTAGIGIPVLPLMGILFVAGHYRALKITDPAELREAVLGIVIVILALGAITFVRR